MRDLFLVLGLAFVGLMMASAMWGDKSGYLLGIPTSQYGNISSIGIIGGGLALLLWFAALQWGVGTLSALFWGALGVAAMVGFGSNMGFF